MKLSMHKAGKAKHAGYISPGGKSTTHIKKFPMSRRRPSQFGTPPIQKAGK